MVIIASISDTINGIPAFETDAPSVNKSPSVNKIEEVTELSVPIVDTKGSVEISRPYGSKTTDELISIAQDLEQKLRERIQVVDMALSQLYHRSIFSDDLILMLNSWQALRTPSLIVTDSHRGRGAMHRTDR